MGSGFPLSSECRATAYNNQTHGCFRGVLILPLAEMEGKGGQRMLCRSRRAELGYYLYDPKEKECCGETLIGAGHTCCHGQAFQTPGTAVGQGRCCDGTGYDPLAHACCNEEVLHELTSEGKEEPLTPNSPV